MNTHQPPYTMNHQDRIEAFVQDGLGVAPEHELIKPMPFGEYKSLCREYFGGAPMFSEELLTKRLKYLEQDSKLKEHFRPGWKYCPAIIPFSNFGNALGPDEINNGDALRMLVIDGQGKTVNGFSQKPSRVFNRLPLEIQLLAFEVEPYTSNDPHIVTPEERAKVMIKYELAYRELEKLLGQN